MDTFTFLSELIKAVAWPVTAIVLVVLLRKPIVELIPLLRRLKYKGLVVEFAQGVSELRAEVEAMAKAKGEEAPSIDLTSIALDNLDEFSPRAAIMGAWLEVVQTSDAVAASLSVKSPNSSVGDTLKLGEYLLECKVIDEGQLSVFNKLRQLRNKTLHAEDLDLSVNDARSYVQLASDLAKHIREQGNCTTN